MQGYFEKISTLAAHSSRTQVVFCQNFLTPTAQLTVKKAIIINLLNTINYGSKKINRLGFRFSEDINLISLLKENSSLAFDLPEPQKEKVRVLRELVQEYYTSIDLSKHITLDSPEMVLKSMYPIMKGLEHKEYWVIFTNRRHTHIKNHQTYHRKS